MRLGPDIGEDAAVIDTGANYLVVKTDPITFASDRIGWYLVNVNANDIACMGATPRWLLVTMLLPEGATDEPMVERLFEDVIEASAALGITLCGGHTEVTYGLARPILVGHLIGEVEKDRLVDKDSIRPGDRIILTKGIAIEGTCVIARDKGRDVSSRVEASVIERAASFLFDPGISVVKEALAAASCGGVHGMHDPTEGGLATGLWELAQRAKVGMYIYWDRIPVLPETRILCDEFGLDPMGLLASGALVVVADPSRCGEIMEAIRSEGAQCAEIGEIRDPGSGMRVESGHAIKDLRPFPADELARVFSEKRADGSKNIKNTVP